MKIAFINHSGIQLPREGKPLHSDSIGLWHYQVATRLARSAEVTVYNFSPGYRGATVERCAGVTFKSFPVGFDRKRHRALAALSKLGRAFGRQPDRRSPRFASEAYYRGFGARVSRDLVEQGFDLVHITNFSQFVMHVRRLNPELPIALHMQCDWLTQLEPTMVERRLGECARVSGCSEFIDRRIREAFPAHAQKCHALLNGVELARFEGVPAEEREPASPPYILFIGRLSPEKGVHLLIEVFARLRERWPELRLKLVGPANPAPFEFIVGVDPDPLVSELERFYDHKRRPLYIRHLESLAQRIPGVEFVGARPQGELRSLLEGAAAFVFPSVWNEPFGMPIIEAMAAGVPVVTTRGGGIPELVDHERDGLLVAPGDADELRGALERLLGDPALGRRLACAAQRRVHAARGWDEVVEELHRGLLAAV